MTPEQGGGAIVSEDILRKEANLFKKEKSEEIQKEKNKLQKMIKLKKQFETKQKRYSSGSSIIENTKDTKTYDMNIDENKLFFMKREMLVVKFTKFILETVRIPIKSIKLFKDKTKIQKKIESNLKVIQDKYSLKNLENDKKNNGLIEFIKEYNEFEKSQNQYRMILSDSRNEEETVNNIMRMYKNNLYNFLKLKKRKIKDDIKIKTYFLDKKKLERNQADLDDLNSNFRELSTEIENFNRNLKLKKNKFYTMNSLFLEEIDYIVNEFTMADYFSILISKHKKNEYINKVNESYMFFYILNKKLEQIHAHILKNKDKLNEDFKKLFLRDKKLREEMEKTKYKLVKNRINAELESFKDELFTIKFNFFNIKQCVIFDEDIMRKSNYFMNYIEYIRCYIEGIYLYKKLEQEIINNKGLIQTPKSSLLFDETFGNKLKINKIKLGKMLDSILQFLNKVMASKKRLFLFKKIIQTEYLNIVDKNLKLAEEINSKVVVSNRAVKDSQDIENTKVLKEGEDKKIKLQGVVQDLINLNKQYLIIKNPEDVLIGAGIVRFKNVKLNIKIKNSKKIKKVLRKKLVFNEVFLKQYGDNKDSLIKKIRNISNKMLQLKKFNSINQLVNFIPNVSRKKTKKTK
jgi:hypothetical protein